MKAFLFLIGSTLIALTINSQALPKEGVLKLTSPDKECTLQLADTKEPWTYELKIIRHGVEFAHYPFEGELISAYWSPSIKLVAVNNHDGHGGIVVWLISLIDGSILTSHGVVRSRDYNRYLDYDVFPDLRQVAGTSLKDVYPKVDDDQLRNGYTSVAYGWKGDDQLLMFHEFPYDYLFGREKRIIQAYSIWKITSRSVILKSIAFKKVKDMPEEPMPREVYKTLNFKH